MIYIRHLGAAPGDIEKDFDAALIRTHALKLASEEALREAQVDLAHVDTTAHGQWSYLVEPVFSICLRRE